MKQKGNIYIYIASVLAIAVVTFGIVHSVISYVDGLIAAAKKSGQDECNIAYTKRDNEQLAAANKEILRLQTALKSAEEQGVKDVNQIGAQLQEKINENQKLAARNNYLTGANRVRESAFQARACPGDAVGPNLPQAPGTSTAGNDTPVCDLSAGTKQSLRSIGARADETALQLAACQSLVLKDRVLCQPIK